jgi:hypothetical protein
MKNKKLLIIISITVLVIGAGLWYIISKSKAAADKAAADGTGAATAKPAISLTKIVNAVQPTSTKTANFPLSMGSRGSQVQKLQKLYNDNVIWFGDPLPLIVEDGIWGPKTNEAVKAMWNLDQVTESWYNEKVTAFTSTASTASSSKTSEQVYKEYLAGMSANYTK